MVCLGNILRYPLAKGFLQSKLPHDSFGGIGRNDWKRIGQAPDRRSIEVAAQNGIDISLQKIRKFTTDDYDLFDKIFVINSSNL